MTKVIKLVDLPPQDEAKPIAEENATGAQERTNVGTIRHDLAMAISPLANKYDISYSNVHGKLGQDGVEYTLTMTLRGKA